MVLTHQPPYVLGNQVEVQRDRKKVKEKEDDAEDEKSIFEEELKEETNSESEQLEIESSEVQLPPSDDITGSIDEHGFEWLEWPEGSGINYYRKPDSEESWAIWSSE